MLSDLVASCYRESLVDKGGVNSVSIWLESWTATKAVVKVPTFQIIVLQGLVGSLPWTAMVFFTLWFELIGEHKHDIFDIVFLRKYQVQNYGVGTNILRKYAHANIVKKSNVQKLQVATIITGFLTALRMT